MSIPKFEADRPALPASASQRIKTIKMRDIFMLSFFFLMTGLAIYRPWLMTLAYLYVDLVQPQYLSYYLFAGGRISLIFGVLALIFFFGVDKKNIRFGFVQLLLAIFIVWFTFTTSIAVIHDDQAWIRWSNGWKAVGFGIFLPFVLATRRRLEGAIALSVLCIAVVTVSAGLKTATGGGGYKELAMIVQVNQGLYESSTIATVAISIIPLILYLYNHSPLVGRTRVTLLGVMGLIGCSILTMIGVEARTGLVCLAVLVGLIWWRMKARVPIAAAAIAIGIVSLPLLPPSFVARMRTIAHPEQDVSASTRTKMWKWTLDFVKTHPFGGGFRVYRLSTFTVAIPQLDSLGQPTGQTKLVAEKARAFHSSYFEVLGEHGWPGLFLYVSIIVSTLLTLVATRARALRGPAEEMWAAHLARALFRAVLIYAIGGLFVGLSMQTTLYTLVAFAVALAQISAPKTAVSQIRRRLLAASRPAGAAPSVA